MDVSERPRELLVSGHANVDRFLSVARFPPADRTVPLTGHRAELGGTAVNIARAASRFGVATGLVSFVGEEFPPAFEARLVKAGIDLRGFVRVPGSPTPTCFIVEDRRRVQRTFIDQGPMGDLAGTVLPGEWLREYSWLHLTTGDPEFQLRLGQKARDLGLRVAADPAQELRYRWDRPHLRRLLALSEVLFGNRDEIAFMGRLLGGTGGATLLREVPLVVRTEGRGGATAFTRVGQEHVPAVRARVNGSAVGAGDAFRGGFYAGFFAGRPLRECLAAGVRSSTRWIEDPA